MWTRPECTAPLRGCLDCYRVRPLAGEDRARPGRKGKADARTRTGDPFITSKRDYIADSAISLQMRESGETAESVEVHRSPQHSSNVFQRCSNRSTSGSAASLRSAQTRPAAWHAQNTATRNPYARNHRLSASLRTCLPADPLHMYTRANTTSACSWSTIRRPSRREHSVPQRGSKPNRRRIGACTPARSSVLAPAAARPLSTWPRSAPPCSACWAMTHLHSGPHTGQVRRSAWTR
jgi:hypothetical protein